MKQIHIVGCSSRSGTTLMSEMMSNCFDIEVKTKEERRISLAPPRRGKTILTKTPKDIILIKDMLYFIPTLYVIYMLRDPRDVVVSMHPLDKDRYWTTLKEWMLFTKMGEDLKDHPRFITVRYEDLVMHPDDVQEMILQRLPFLKKTVAFSSFDQAAKPSSSYVTALRGLRPVSTKSIGNWKNHKARLAGQMQKFGSISSELIAYGYEKDTSWEHELKGVIPDLRDSHCAVFSSGKYIRDKLRWNKLRALRVLINHSQPFMFFKERIHRV